MHELGFILASRPVDFNLTLQIDVQEGREQLKQLFDDELNQPNCSDSYRLIGSFSKNQSHVTIVIERQDGNKRFDVIKGHLDILEDSSFKLKGILENKCKIYGEVFIVIFLIGLSIYTIPNISSDDFLYLLIFPAFIIWLLIDIYLRPKRALNFLKKKLIKLNNTANIS